VDHAERSFDSRAGDVVASRAQICERLLEQPFGTLAA
jgi:hypothetical protein